MTASVTPDAPEPRIRADDFFAYCRGTAGAERANAQPFLLKLAAVLGVPEPALATGDPARDGYVFERPLDFADGTKARGFIDLYKRGAFVLETKQGADEKRTATGRKLRQGHGLRGSRAWEATMDAARNQAEGYARNLEAAEPAPEGGAATVEALLARFDGATRAGVAEALDALADRGLVAEPRGA